MDQQKIPLELIQRLKKELRGKLEHSVEVQVDQLIAQIEQELEQEATAERNRKVRGFLLSAFGLLLRCLPEIKRIFDEQ